MITETSIPHAEHRSVVKLMMAHSREYGSKLRAMVLFGDLILTGQTFDIDLLEVVEGWDAARSGRVAEFSSSSELPLRGKLRIYFLSPEEFERPEVILDPAERAWVSALLQRVTSSYELVYQVPIDYARNTLSRQDKASVLSAPPSGLVVTANPLRPACLP